MIRTVSLLALGLGLSACAQIGHPDPFADQTQYVFGKAVQQNIDAQTVNPDGAAGELESGAARAATAQDRYRADKVEKPAQATTTQVGGQGGQGGGGSGGGGGSN